MRENRNHVVAIVEIALNARAADGSRLYDLSVQDAGVAALQQLLTHFQGTGEFRASFDPHVMAMAIRAAINAVPAQLARDPALDIGHHAREIADLFHLATRPGEAPGTFHQTAATGGANEALRVRRHAGMSLLSGQVRGRVAMPGRLPGWDHGCPVSASGPAAAGRPAGTWCCALWG